MQMRDLDAFMKRTKVPRCKKRKQGALGRDERITIKDLSFYEKPRGIAMQVLLQRINGPRRCIVRASAFDCIMLPIWIDADLTDPEQIAEYFPEMIFGEIKKTWRADIGPDFSRLFFSISRNQILAAKHLREQYLFIFYNMVTKSDLLMNLEALLERTKYFEASFTAQFA